MTSVGEKKKANTIQLPLLAFSHLQLVSGRTKERNLKCLKKRGSEDKCSWSDDVIRSTSSKAHFTRSISHQKLIEVELQKGCSKDLITPYLCKRLVG